jgi:LmbE family N-acetylglucosaminyl deacetylase
MEDRPSVLAVGAHPDDIEFMMSGTLMLLGDRGWQIHYMNLANGSCGTVTETIEQIVARRRDEAVEAAGSIGAEYHDSIAADLEILYTTDLVRQTLAVVRRARPRIVLVPSPQDYMEDHVNTMRIAVTAAFARGFRNYPSVPPEPPIEGDVTIYHALPHGLRGPLREPIRAGQYVDVTGVIARKRQMLACHRSQKEWLDKSQGIDSYLDTMEEFARQAGRRSGRFSMAEGWRRRSHFGFSQEDTDPLGQALGDLCVTDKEYERDLCV